MIVIIIMIIITITATIIIVKFIIINIILLFDNLFFLLQILEIIKIKNKTTITIGNNFK